MFSQYKSSVTTILESETEFYDLVNCVSPSFSALKLLKKLHKLSPELKCLQSNQFSRNLTFKNTY